MKIRDLYIFVIDTNLAESAFSKYDSEKNSKSKFDFGTDFQTIINLD